MSATRKLNELAARKLAVQLRIAQRRIAMAEAMNGVARPLAWIDAGHDLWSRVAPFVKIAAGPLGLLAGRYFLRGSLRRKATLARTLWRSASALWKLFQRRRAA